MMRLGRRCSGLAVVALTLAACGQLPTTDPARTVSDPATTAPASGPATSAPATPAPTPAGPTAPGPTAAEPTTPGPSPSATPTPASPSPAPTQPAAIMAEGASGEQVRELQVRLRQLDWFAGTITGTYAESTVTGVKGFQGKRKLSATGTVDATTWAKLKAMTTTPSTADKHNKLVPGPALLEQGSTGDQVRELQARLKQLGWFSGNVTATYGSQTAAAVKGFQAKRAIPETGEVDQRTWSRLTAMSREPSSDELHNITPKPSAAGLDSRCLTGRALCVSKTTDSLVWVVDGKAQLKVDVRFGSQELPTREGAFAVGWKSRNHVSTIYHTSMPYAMFFSGGQAVHYSPDFAARGYNGASHGCVNVRNLSAIKWLFDEVRVGDKVIVYR